LYHFYFHQENGKIEGYNRTPKAYKLHKKHVTFVLEEIKKNKTITIDGYTLIPEDFDCEEPSKQASQKHLQEVTPCTGIDIGVYCFY
jgi:hypothetical protein